MMVAIAESLDVARAYQTIDTHYDEANRALWCIWNGTDGSCFSATRLGETRRFQQWVEGQVRGDLESGREPGIRHVVFASSAPGVFSFGGDLAYFAQMIRDRDRRALEAYIDVSFEALAWIACQRLPIQTVALVQGTTLGAGFEIALACDAFITEEQVEPAFPEAVFNLFPGMGGYNVLARNMGPRAAEQALIAGRSFGANELHHLGLVDEVAPSGAGEAALATHLRRQRRNGNTRRALLEARRHLNPVTRNELYATGRTWVDAAMRLSERDLRRLDRLVYAQRARGAGADTPPADSRALLMRLVRGGY